MRVANSISSTCYNESGIAISSDSWLIDLETSPFTFSQKNKLTVVGCNDVAVMYATTINGNVSVGCLGLCGSASDVRTGKCSGNGCCQTSIPKGLSYYHISLSTLSNRTNASQFNPCGFTFLGQCPLSPS